MKNSQYGDNNSGCDKNERYYTSDVYSNYTLNYHEIMIVDYQREEYTLVLNKTIVSDRSAFHNRVVTKYLISKKGYAPL